MSCNSSAEEVTKQDALDDSKCRFQELKIREAELTIKHKSVVFNVLISFFVCVCVAFLVSLFLSFYVPALILLVLIFVITGVFIAYFIKKNSASESHSILKMFFQLGKYILDFFKRF